MTNEANSIDPEAWKYAEKTLTWHGWGSTVGLGLFIVAIGAFVALLHVAGVVGSLRSQPSIPSSVQCPGRCMSSLSAAASAA
jgi:hypothetical protein